MIRHLDEQRLALAVSLDGVGATVEAHRVRTLPALTRPGGAALEWVLVLRDVQRRAAGWRQADHRWMDVGTWSERLLIALDTVLATAMAALDAADRRAA